MATVSLSNDPAVTSLFSHNVKIDGTLTNAELQNATNNINTISGKVKHITSDAILTKMDSRLKIVDNNNETVILLHDIMDESSFFKTEVTFHNTIYCLSNIVNTELQNATANITANTNAITENTNNITTNRSF